MTTDPLPTLAGLPQALGEVVPWLRRARAASTATTNAEGGDPASHADPRLLTRHLGHYLLAVEVAAGRGIERLVDVGSGTGAYTGWMAERLGASVGLVDHDEAVLRTAAAVTSAVDTTRRLEDVEPALLVTAMEVLEHVPPASQPAFCSGLVGAVAPGGLLVVSTPDESLYPGGWSGYAPHVGCVTAGDLRALLVAAGGGAVDVLRITGGPYDTSMSRRWGEAVGNRAWTAVQRIAPTAAARLSVRGGDDGTVPDVDPASVGATAARVGTADSDRGGSLIAIVRMPS